jgi:hypothetical protein
MEVSLAPCGIARRSVGVVACGDDPSVHGVNVDDVEYRPTPPLPVPIAGLGGQVQVARPGTETGETGVLATMDEVEAQRSVEAHGAWHIVGSQGQRRDGFDYRLGPPRPSVLL